MWGKIIKKNKKKELKSVKDYNACNETKNKIGKMITINFRSYRYFLKQPC